MNMNSLAIKNEDSSKRSIYGELVSTAIAFDRPRNNLVPLLK